jgi:hypothetical protein
MNTLCMTRPPSLEVFSPLQGFSSKEGEFWAPRCLELVQGTFKERARNVEVNALTETCKEDSSPKGTDARECELI